MGFIGEDLACEHLRAMVNNADELHLVERWQSRTASLFRFGKDSEPGIRDVVLKVSPTWTVDHVRSIAENSALLEGLKCQGAVVRVVAQDVERRAVLFEYVEGIDLVAVVETQLRDGAISDALALFRGAGELLAAMHDHPPYQMEAGDPEDWKKLGSVVRRKVLCAGDYACYNLRVATFDSAVVLLEPPAWQRVVPVHRDLAWFLYSASRFSGAASPAVAEAMQSAFIDGYREAVRSGDTWGIKDELVLDLARSRMNLAKRNLRLRRRIRAISSR